MYQLKGMTITEIAQVCRAISGTCHRYKIESVTRSRVKISYSNPNEYGSERPIFAYYPIVLYQANNDQGTIACLEFGHYTGAGEDWQAFYAITCARVEWNKEREQWIVSHN